MDEQKNLEYKTNFMNKWVSDHKLSFDQYTWSTYTSVFTVQFSIKLKTIA